MKKRFDVKHLDCANCALKIEGALNQLDGVTEATVDFTKEKISLVGKIEKYNSKDIEKIAQSIEYQVRVYDEDHTQDIKKKNNLELIFNMIGAVLFLILFFLEKEILPWISVSMYLTSYLLIGGSIIFRAVKGILKGQFFDEHFLMSLATIGALFIHQYVEAVAVMLFYRVGEYFQNRAINHSRKSIQSLMNIKPIIAHLIENEMISDTNPESLMINQIIVVKPGEQIPVDGKIIDGQSSLDTSMLTGESTPVDVFEGQDVLSGAINIHGVLRILVTRVYQDSTVAKIIAFVEENANKKAKTEKFITKFAKYYTPIVVTLAIGLAFLGPAIFSLIRETSYLSEFPTYFKRSLIFLVISCPCALVLSIPLSFYAGIGATSKQGVLVKSGSDVEMIKEIDHFVFDKTGTLTKGQFEVAKIVSSNPEQCLKYAAYIESHSNHPIAKSIMNAYGKEIEYVFLENIEEIFGRGIRAEYDGKILMVGNQRMFNENNIAIDDAPEIGTISYVAYDQKCLGYLVIKDQIKENSFRALSKLRQMGKNVSMITGDHKQTAEDIAMQLGIKNVYADALPQDKIDIINKLKVNEKVAFIGDGVNDAPVLLSAHLGIAMGGIGSDAAIEASDIVLMKDDPYQIIDAHRVSMKTMSIVKQNIILALGIKGIVLIMGALGYAEMWLAIFADVGVSLLAVFNTLRILRKYKTDNS